MLNLFSHLTRVSEYCVLKLGVLFLQAISFSGYFLKGGKLFFVPSKFYFKGFSFSKKN